MIRIDINIRYMLSEDYDQVYKLWKGIEGFAIRSIDDSRENVTRVINRNPNISVVAECEGKIVGAILAGHDGRRGCLYHVCVNRHYRNQGIGTNMTRYAIEALKREQINHVSLIAFSSNNGGNTFWHELGWKQRDDINYYDMVLNEENQIKYTDKEEEE